MAHRNDQQQQRQQGSGAQHRNQMGGGYNEGPRHQQAAYQGNPGQYSGHYGADTHYSGPQQHGGYETLGNIRGNEDNFNHSFGTSGDDGRQQNLADVPRGYDDSDYRDHRSPGRGTRPWGDYDPEYGVRGGYPGYRDEHGHGHYGPGQGYGDPLAGQPHHDPDYQQWRREQIRGLDEDYRAWRSERYNNFTSEFGEWRRNRQAGGGEAGNKGVAGTDNGGSAKSK